MIFKLTVIRAYHRGIVSSIAFILHHMNQLFLGQPVVGVTGRLMRVIDSLGGLTKLFLCLALGT